MHRLRRHAVVPIILGGALCAAAHAGPTWPEGPDAGPLPFGAQKTYGPGSIASIIGTLGGPGPAPLGARGVPGDFQDMYLIKIVDPLSFMAATDPFFNGLAEFDSQLYLFTGPDHPAGPGLGMFANDESPFVGSGFSLLGNATTDGIAHPQLLADTHYFLAISGFDSDPISASGEIFNQAMRDEQSGPDGMGGSDPIANWSNAGDFGEYVIAIQGVDAQTLCSPSDINNDGVTDTADLAILLSQFGAPVSGNADLNFDGVVDTSDLGILIATFGDVCP